MKLPAGFKKIVENNVMSLATANSRGRPHAIAVTFVKVRDGKLVITDNYMGSTATNIRKRQFVSIAVWDKNWTGFGIDGKAEYHSSGKWHEFIKSLKENAGEPCKGAIVVTPLKIRKLA